MCACITRNERLTEELHLWPRFRGSSDSKNAFLHMYLLAEEVICAYTSSVSR